MVLHNDYRFVSQNLCCLSVIKDFVKLKKYNLQSLVAPAAEAQKITSESTAAKTSVNVAGKTDNDSQTTVSPADTTDSKDTADKTDTGDHDNQTTVSTTDTSDCKDTAGDQTVSVTEIADSASDQTTATIDDTSDTVVGDSNVAESVECAQESGAELSSSGVSTESLSATEAGDSAKTAAVQIAGEQ